MAQEISEATAAEIERGSRAIRLALKTVDELLPELGKLRGRLANAKHVLDATAPDIEAAKFKQALLDVQEMARQIELMQSELTKRADLLSEVRHSGAKPVAKPAPLKEPKLSPLELLDARVVGVRAQTDLGRAEKALERVLAEVKRDKALAPFVGLVQFHIGETLRERALGLITKAETNSRIRTRNNERAAALLRRASDCYGKAGKGSDMQAGSVGSSIHATALGRTVEVQAQLYLGYRELSKREPNADSWKKFARRHGGAANVAFDKLGEKHKDARLSNGGRVIDYAKLQVQRMR